EKAPLDINRAIETTATVTRNQWKYVAELKFDFDDELPEVPCLAGEFNQVILNLIVNAADAIDAMRGEGELGEIHVGTRRVGEWVEITVADTGCGMTEEVQARIFDPFFTTKDVGKGTGQGLSIVYNIIRTRHGGEILCDSAPGEGATFTVRLPLTPQERAEG
ncbi:MAG: HAMP domain-containing histidine kinase, partial [Caulobacterales bacterium]|nr:HAMP domain-containing histidine kinase [Caulobacterales bacterium]